MAEGCSPMPPSRRSTPALAATLLVGVAVLFTVRLLSQEGIAQERVRRAACFNNLKQIGQAISAYRADNAGQYPKALQTLYPKYLTNKSALVCKSDNNPTPEDAYSSYQYNPPSNAVAPGDVLVHDKDGVHLSRGSLHAGQNNLRLDGQTFWSDAPLPYANQK